MGCMFTGRHVESQTLSPLIDDDDSRRVGQCSNQTDPHLPFEWDGDKPVPLVDRGLVAEMDKTAQSLRRQTTGPQAAVAK